MSITPHCIEPDFSSADFIRNPYSSFRIYRERTPVFSNKAGVVYLTRHGDCADLFGSPDCLRQPPGKTVTPFGSITRDMTALERMINHWLIFMDPPRHDVVRKAFLPVFTAKAVKQLKPLIVAQVGRLLDQFPSDGNVDLIKQFSAPLPLRIIGSIMGLPDDDFEKIYAWSTKLSVVLDTGEEAAMHAGEETALAMHRYFSDLLAQRHELRPDCIINTVSDISGSMLTPDELLYGYAFLLFSGNETTRHLISSGILTLAQNPAQLDALRKRPQLAEEATDEMIRFESPVQKISRWTHKDVLFGDYRVKSGTHVTALIGAANRDPETFEQPDLFDIQRPSNRHLGFGAGSHYCLGSLLARLESSIAFQELLARTDGIESAEFRWRPVSSMRSLDILHARVRLK